MTSVRSYDVLPESPDIINHEADLKGNIFRCPTHRQSLIVMAFGTEGDKTDQTEKAQSENQHIHCTYIQYFSFDFPCTGISLKFHC